jgi:hypothetical protein
MIVEDFLPYVRTILHDQGTKTRCRDSRRGWRADGRAVAALETSHAQDPSPVVRKKAGWFTPGGTIYRRTIPRAPR